jgi:MAF protein
MTERRLVLASTSRYRKALLERLGVSFTCFAPHVDEARRTDESADTLVQRLALAKAKAGADTHPDALVIGSDQVADCEGAILGKSGGHDAAVEQLRRLAGRRVIFHTGLCLYDARTSEARVEMIPFAVLFRKLTDRQIERYVRVDRPYDCAGSFKSEGLGISLFERMEGDDPTALVGLPLIRLTQWLNETGVAVP